MSPVERHHIRSVEAEVRDLRDTLVQQRAWIEHWLADRAANLQPSKESLESAHRQVDAALRAGGYR
jgi:plasmid stability protein